MRRFHSLLVFVIAPHQFLLVVTGGIGPLLRQPFSLSWKKIDLVALTVLIDLGEQWVYCLHACMHVCNN